MYLPAQFNKSQDRALAARIVHEHPFASLISNDDSGFPYATPLPLHLVEEGESWKLLGHVAKPNPHWKYLAARPEALVTFMGPHAYMSPKVYPDLARVPTWNYLAVHCKVKASLIEDPEAKDRLLKKLIGDHEPPYKQQWIDLGTEYQHKMLMGIVAFELEVIALECKIKVNQHRPEAQAKMLQMYSQGNAQEQALAHWIKAMNTPV
ncbi:FMN-binding negative transcriptional regulator [Variovorax sp. PCZ-1]|uniref:FMN-binding negative transcriptional regulator n=1 Tax=Variovorax sp. PCZ-1 TaxID=2835533 RepID=UPI001BCA9F65|nr:FMN-binding negative transcriptional regulator [Variovorax sp. PCZ-1]MBS7807503.1 FMN-binding negative transcriptional regulator [Variovorax sp. PCZ-1]